VGRENTCGTDDGDPPRRGDMIVLAWLLCAANAGVLLLVFWNVLAWPTAKPAIGRPAANVSVLIPARNEARQIATCLDSVISQGDSVGEILVYDDGSEDETAQLVRAASARDNRIRLVESSPLPPGWCGKTFACHQLALQANSEWLLFLDADVRLKPGAVRAIVEEATTRRASLLSLWPGIEAVGFWESVLMPMLTFVVVTLFPAPLSLRRRNPSLGIAHGACILAHRRVYARLGGHALVYGELFEDTKLARAWRAHGEFSVCLDGRLWISVRMYDSLKSIRNGFVKNFYPGFNRQRSFWLFLLFHAIVFLAPFLILPPAFARGDGELPLALSCASILVGRAVLAGRFGHPFWSVLFHPVAEFLLVWTGLSSWWCVERGRGVEWKGRRYRTRGVEPNP